MRKVFNFSAGPGMLPEEVLLEVQAELLNWHGSGMSIMELGHRGHEFKEVAEQAEQDLRDLMFIPKSYRVLFLPGGASTQFAMVPLNLFSKDNKKADYVDTGVWSKKAIEEAKLYGDINIAATCEPYNDLTFIPHPENWNLNEDAAYVHYTPNETIDGVEFNWIPETGKVPLVADMSSMILSRPIDVTKYSVIYAGAQKNIGQAGITVVIINEDFIREPLANTPTLYSYQTHAQHQSFYNTPPTFSWYIAGRMFAWVKRNGGVDAFFDRNLRKADKLYDYIDSQRDFYQCKVHPECRSLMNVVFNLPTEELVSRFVKEAEKVKLTNLKGHRVVGGIRASIYNSMPEEGVDALIEFMKDFIKRNG